MADKKILGAIAIGDAVYREGQEAEMEAAAKEAKVNLSDTRFDGVLVGFAREPKTPAKTPAKEPAKEPAKTATGDDDPK